MDQTPQRTRGRIIVPVLVVVLLVLAAGLAIAQSGTDGGGDAPVVTIHSTVQEQIAGLEYALAQARENPPNVSSQDGLDGYELDLLELESRIAELCGELPSTESAAIDACAR